MNTKFISQLASKVATQLKRPFSWLSWGTLFDTPAEWHAFVEGLADGFCLTGPRYKLWNEGAINLLESLRKEHHYYNAGRAFGFAGFILLIAGMVVWMIKTALQSY